MSTVPPLKGTFIVDRTKWYRGHGKVGSRLLRQDGDMCCVGFFASQALRLSGRRIMNAADLLDVREEGAEPRGWFMDIHVEISGACIYETNDDATLTEPTRESMLRAAFREIGYGVRFRNGTQRTKRKRAPAFCAAVFCDSCQLCDPRTSRKVVCCAHVYTRCMHTQHHREVACTRRSRDAQRPVKRSTRRMLRQRACTRFKWPSHGACRWMRSSVWMEPS